jgi:GGDEF domain-containing protein
MGASQARILAERGERALADHASDPAALRDPLLPAVLRYLDEALGGRRDRAALLRRWEGNPVQSMGRRRYRWPIAWDDDPESPMPWSRSNGQERVLWRPLEQPILQRDPVGFASRLLLPVILTEALEFLEETVREDPGLAVEAAALRDEAAAKIEHDFARCVMADDTWGDTFALWQLTRHGRALDRLEPLAIALATRFATRARLDEARVLGTDYPFFDEQLDSASAHLGAALWALGMYPSLLPPLITGLRERQRPDGGWGDPGQSSDVLTTLAVVDALAHLDPGFTLERASADTDGGRGRQAANRAVAFFGRHQEAAGWWRAFDPETPWLTARICGWLRSIEQPFAARFRWPHLARWQRDRKTGVPLFAFYADLARAAEGLSGLGEAPVEVAFLDLIGFGAWNKQYGQERGDELLAVLAGTLAGIAEGLVVRDGGDEFLVVGKPGEMGVLLARLEAFRLAWPDRCRAALPDVPPVETRVVLGGGAMSEALAIRGRLGRAVGEIAAFEPTGPDEGVMGLLDEGGLRVLHGRRKAAA